MKLERLAAAAAIMVVTAACNARPESTAPEPTNAPIQRLIRPGETRIRPAEPTATLTRQITPDRLPIADDQRLIQQEVQRLGILQSAKEQEKWREKGYQLSINRIPINDSSIELARRRLLSTLDLMDESENPYYKHTSDFLFPLVRNREFSFNIYGTPDTRKPGIVISSDIRATDETLTYYTSIDADLILNRLEPADLAAAIAHEARHIEDLWNFQQSLDQSLTPQRRFEAQRRIEESDPETLLHSEIRGYALHSQAYIYQYGLLGGQRAKTGSSIEMDAAEFIRAGNDVNSPAWRAFIQRVVID